MQLFLEHFGNITLLLFFATEKIFINPKTWQMFYMEHVHVYRRKHMLSKLHMSKMATQAMKTYILGSAAAGHGESLNRTTCVDFHQLGPTGPSWS